RRHRVHAHRECSGGRGARRLEERAQAGVGRRAVRAQADAAAVALLRSPRDRRRHGGPLHRLPREAPRRHATRDAVAAADGAALLFTPPTSVTRTGERNVMATQEVKVPDIGDFKDVPVIQVFVKAGDAVKVEDPLISLESDKATMDVPAPAAGTVKELKVKVGDRVSEGRIILVLETAAAAEAPRAPAATTEPRPAAAASAPRSTAPAPAAAAGEYRGQADVQAGMLVIGAGPGGYSAAFRAADLGLKTVLVERYPRLGGVCLNVGCIPSKALLHVARVIDEVEEVGHFGVSFGSGKPGLDLDKLRGWKESVVKKLTGGLSTLAKQRKVAVLQGVAQFLDAHHVEVAGEGKKQVVRFDQCIIAAGSQAAKLPFLPADPRIIDSTGALEPPGVPGRTRGIRCG